MTLQRLLKDMMTKRPERYRHLLGDLSDRLRETALAGVLKPGDSMPAFVLPDTQGELFLSDNLLAEGPLVVVFVRGGWCPFCQATLQALDRVAADIQAAGANLVALTPDVRGFSSAEWRDLRLGFPVLNDVDSAAGLQFGAIFRVPDRLRDFYLEAGIDLTIRNGDQSWLLPMPATFVADRDGIIRYAYASGDITDRVEPDAILATVQSILSRGGNGTAERK